VGGSHPARGAGRPGSAGLLHGHLPDRRVARGGSGREPCRTGGAAADRGEAAGTGDAERDLLARARMLSLSNPVVRSEDLIIERLVRPEYRARRAIGTSGRGRGTGARRHDRVGAADPDRRRHARADARDRGGQGDPRVPLSPYRSPIRRAACGPPTGLRSRSTDRACRAHPTPGPGGRRTPAAWRLRRRRRGIRPARGAVPRQRAATSSAVSAPASHRRRDGPPAR